MQHACLRGARAFFVAFAGFATLAAFAAPARATEQPDDVSPAERGEGDDFTYTGRGFFAGGGIGMVSVEEPDIALTDERSTAGAWKLMLAFPFHELFAVEIIGSGIVVPVIDHHLEEVTPTGLGIGTGIRFSAPPSWALRPYVAGRFHHYHFWPDPWGDHDEAGVGSEHHASHHRWGGAVGAGLDAGIFGPTSRWRAGLDAELLALSGPGVGPTGQVLAVLGVGF